MLNLLFGAAGLFMSSLVKRPRPITTLGIGLVLFLYFIFTVSKITESSFRIGMISPFKYVNMEVTSPTYGLEIWKVVYFIGFTLILTFISYRLILQEGYLFIGILDIRRLKPTAWDG